MILLLNIYISVVGMRIADLCKAPLHSWDLLPTSLLWRMLCCHCHTTEGVLKGHLVESWLND